MLAPGSVLKKIAAPIQSRITWEVDRVYIKVANVYEYQNWIIYKVCRVTQYCLTVFTLAYEKKVEKNRVILLQFSFFEVARLLQTN